MQNEGTFYGYARVSTERQDVTSQVNQLEAAGCTTIFREKLTGTPAVDRLSRDTTDDMQRAGARLRSLAEPVLDTTGGFAELVLAMLGVAAKLERIARGRDDAKAKGVKFGRKPKLTPHQARERIGQGETQRSVARTYNVSQATISRLPSKRE